MVLAAVAALPLTVPAAPSRSGHPSTPHLRGPAVCSATGQLAEADTRLYEHLLGTITAPVRLLWGRHDRIRRPEDGTWLHERIPHSTLHWIDDAGHLLQEDRPAEPTAHLLTRPDPRATPVTGL